MDFQGKSDGIKHPGVSQACEGSSIVAFNKADAGAPLCVEDGVFEVCDVVKMTIAIAMATCRLPANFGTPEWLSEKEPLMFPLQVTFEGAEDKLFALPNRGWGALKMPLCEWVRSTGANNALTKYTGLVIAPNYPNLHNAHGTFWAALGIYGATFRMCRTGGLLERAIQVIKKNNGILSEAVYSELQAFTRWGSKGTSFAYLRGLCGKVLGTDGLSIDRDSIPTAFQFRVLLHNDASVHVDEFVDLYHILALFGADVHDPPTQVHDSANERELLEANEHQVMKAGFGLAPSEYVPYVA